MSTIYAKLLEIVRIWWEPHKNMPKDTVPEIVTINCHHPRHKEDTEKLMAHHFL